VALFNSILTGESPQLRTDSRLIMPTITASDVCARLLKVKIITQLVHHWLGTKDKGPLLWDKFKTIV
jgi:hypothetical protein